MINWQQWFLTVISTAAPIILYLWRQKEHAKKVQEERHTENARKLDAILNEQEYLPQHWHSESQGTLTAGGIQRKPRNGK